MEQEKLRRELAVLETKYDHLLTDFEELNRLLIEVGFEEGIKTLKETAEEVVSIRKEFDL